MFDAERVWRKISWATTIFTTAIGAFGHKDSLVPFASKLTHLVQERVLTLPLEYAMTHHASELIEPVFPAVRHFAFHDGHSVAAVPDALHLTMIHLVIWNEVDDTVAMLYSVPQLLIDDITQRFPSHITA